MYGTLKKIIAFAGSKEGLLKKSLLFAFLSGLFAALQFAALFIVVEALPITGTDGLSGFLWASWLFPWLEGSSRPISPRWSRRKPATVW